MTQKEKSKNKNTVISKPCFWMKHNELQIVTLKNHDPDILDHLFQKKCYVSCYVVLIIPHFDFHDINFCLMEFCGFFDSQKEDK